VEALPDDYPADAASAAARLQAAAVEQAGLEGELRAALAAAAARAEAGYARLAEAAQAAHAEGGPP
jgi:hypothetical protein